MSGFNSFILAFLCSSALGFIMAVRIIVIDIKRKVFLGTSDEWMFWLCVGIVIAWIIALVYAINGGLIR